MENHYKSNHEAREDGNATKLALIEAAGKLIAAKGYEKTTAKEICHLAGTNTAAVNYHFGSRAGLYQAVLSEAYQHIVGIEELQKLEAKNLSATEKMNDFLDMLIQAVMQEENWFIRVVMREYISPSSIARESISKEVLPKIARIRTLFSQYLGLPAADSRLYACMIGTVSTFLWMLLFQNSEISNVTKDILPLKEKKREILLFMKQFSLAGMQATQKS